MTDDRDSTPRRPTPHLTIIVVAFVDGPCLERCLARLVPQTAGVADVDVVVATDDRVTERAALVHQYPTVKWLHTPGLTHPSIRRSHAVRAARGAYVALLEDHCLVGAEWLTAAREACTRGTAIQGGPIDKWEPDSALNWAGYFLEFTYYMPPISEAGDRASDCNTTYARAALDRVPQAWAKAFHETTVNWALRDLGYAIVRNARQLVYESHPQRAGAALRERVAFGRTFASTRAARLSRPLQLAYAAGTPFLPVVLTWRMARLAGARGRLAAFARALPWFVLLASAWSVGELRGYLAPLPVDG